MVIDRAAAHRNLGTLELIFLVRSGIGRSLVSFAGRRLPATNPVCDSAMLA